MPIPGTPEFIEHNLRMLKKLELMGIEDAKINRYIDDPDVVEESRRRLWYDSLPVVRGNVI